VHVREHPIMGIGLGMPYETFRITEWKAESYMVHNAIVHVWLFYGLFGLIVYLWYHFNLFRWLMRFRQSTDRRVAAIGGASLAYLAAQFAITWGFTPWPYSQTQEDIVIFFLIGALICVRDTIPGETENTAKTDGTK
jgi:O-antigen ligase